MRPASPPLLRRIARRAIPAAAALVAAVPAQAAVQSMAPDQAMADRSSSESSATGGGGLWGDMPRGVALRPYVESLSVTDGGTTTPVTEDGAPPSSVPGDLTAVVTPFNLCRPGESPAGGRCYVSPNRVGVTIGYATQGGGVQTDLAAPGLTPRQPVDGNSVIDLTLRLNTVGRTLRWSWLNGDLVSWSTTGLGTDRGEVHVRLRPVPTPALDWSVLPPNGCTATPVRDCDITQSQGETLSAGLVLSLDDTLPPALTGAVFATQGAISGYLEPGGTPAAPTLDLQIASAHLRDDGTLQRGRLSALIPSHALMELYGVEPADVATFFTARRSGAAGSQRPPVFRPATAAVDGTDGLRVDIDGITFSAPTYAVARRTRPGRVRVVRKAGRVTISAPGLQPCWGGRCTLTVRRIAGVGARARGVSIAAARTTIDGDVAISLPGATLPPGTRYAASLRRTAPRRGPLVTTAVGVAP